MQINSKNLNLKPYFFCATIMRHVQRVLVQDDDSYCTFDLNWQPGPWKARFQLAPSESIVGQVKK